MNLSGRCTRNQLVDPSEGGCQTEGGGLLVIMVLGSLVQHTVTVRPEERTQVSECIIKKKW